MTGSASPVNYTVETYSGTIATGTDTNTALAKLNIAAIFGLGPNMLTIFDSVGQNKMPVLILYLARSGLGL